MIRHLAAASALTLVLVGGVACGSSDDGAADPPATSTTTEPAAVAPTDGGLTAEDLEACLTEAGLEATVPDTVPFGVEVPVDQLEVALEAEGASSDLVASLYVFSSEEEAEANRTAITLQSEDDERNRVAGNVLLAYSIIPSYDPEGAAAVEACLPA